MLCAPESTKALTGWPLTSTSMYSIVMCPNDSGCRQGQPATDKPAHRAGLFFTLTHRILHGMMHVLDNSLHADGLLNPFLRFDIVRIRVELLNLPLLLGLGQLVLSLVPHVLFAEPGARLERIRQRWVALWVVRRFTPYVPVARPDMLTLRSSAMSAGSLSA